MASDHRTAVVIEDDRHISDLVAMYLERDGWDVVQAFDGSTGLHQAARPETGLVILDLGLPGELDGFEVCRRLRRDSSVPLVMVTARDDEIDRVLGLELGADDYVTKPFSPRELVARVHAIERRTETHTPAPPVLTLGELRVDTGRREVEVDGLPVNLTTREFDLLAHLASHPGLVLTRRQLLDGAWGDGWYGDQRTVDVHVRQLRKKLGDRLPLTTVRGVGYRLG